MLKKGETLTQNKTSNLEEDSKFVKITFTDLLGSDIGRNTGEFLVTYSLSVLLVLATVSWSWNLSQSALWGRGEPVLRRHTKTDT